MVELLLKSGADINAESYSTQHYTLERPIVAATRVYDKHIFDLILEHSSHIDLSCDGHKDALQWAATHGDIYMVEELIKLGADVNWIGRNGFTALHYAASGGYKSIVRTLLDKEAEITVNYDWRSPVHLACLNGRSDVLKELLKKTTNVHIKDKYDQTPLSLAALRNNLDLLDMLYPLLITQVESSELQASLDTALTSSVRGTAVNSVKFLLEKGANPNIISSTGTPMIHECCRNGKINLGKHILKLLLTHGARLDACDSEWSCNLLYYTFFHMVDNSFFDILFYHGADAVNQNLHNDSNQHAVDERYITDLAKLNERHVVLARYITNLEQFSEKIHGEIGSLYHDTTLWKLYHIFRPKEDPGEEISVTDKNIVQILCTIPSLAALSRSCVRRRLSIVSGCKTIAPLIYKLAKPPLPQGITKFLLLADVIQESEFKNLTSCMALP